MALRIMANELTTLPAEKIGKKLLPRHFSTHLPEFKAIDKVIDVAHILLSVGNFGHR